MVAQNVGFQFHTIDAEVLALGKNLRLIQHFGVAWDATDAEEARRLKIPLATIAAQNSNAVVTDNKDKIDAIFENLEQTTANFKEFSEDIKRNPWKLMSKGK